jgi:subtilase family serine protease
MCSKILGVGIDQTYGFIQRFNLVTNATIFYIQILGTNFLIKLIKPSIPYSYPHTLRLRLCQGRRHTYIVAGYALPWTNLSADCD